LIAPTLQRGSADRTLQRPWEKATGCKDADFSGYALHWHDKLIRTAETREWAMPVPMRERGSVTPDRVSQTNNVANHEGTILFCNLDRKDRSHHLPHCEPTPGSPQNSPTKDSSTTPAFSPAKAVMAVPNASNLFDS